MLCFIFQIFLFVASSLVSIDFLLFVLFPSQMIPSDEALYKQASLVEIPFREDPFVVTLLG